MEAYTASSPPPNKAIFYRVSMRNNAAGMLLPKPKSLLWRKLPSIPKKIKFLCGMCLGNYGI